ncbi:MAG: hypothetical protein IIZ78_23430, partial [Clostridiales bacterium]|nr:hypothetical protein [Clostridiales bacterium]
MSKYIMLYNCEYIEEDTNAIKHEKGMFIGEKMSEAVEKLEAYYGDGIDKVLIEDLDDEWFADTDGIVTEEQMRKAIRQLNPLKNEEV